MFSLLYQCRYLPCLRLIAHDNYPLGPLWPKDDIYKNVRYSHDLAKCLHTTAFALRNLSSKREWCSYLNFLCGNLLGTWSDATDFHIPHDTRRGPNRVHARLCCQLDRELAPGHSRRGLRRRRACCSKHRHGGYRPGRDHARSASRRARALACMPRFCCRD